MKNISGILAIYILALAIMPCNDIHALDQNASNTFEITDNEHHHDMDFCSPFCSCDCCHTSAEPVIIDINETESETIPFSFFHLSIPEKENIYTFWRPPIFYTINF